MTVTVSSPKRLDATADRCHTANRLAAHLISSMVVKLLYDAFLLRPVNQSGERVANTFLVCWLGWSLCDVTSTHLTMLAEPRKQLPKSRFVHCSKKSNVNKGVQAGVFIWPNWRWSALLPAPPAHRRFFLLGFVLLLAKSELERGVYSTISRLHLEFTTNSDDKDMLHVPCFQQRVPLHPQMWSHSVNAERTWWTNHSLFQ